MSASAPIRKSTVIWTAAHVSGVGVWLLFVQELWHHQEEQRCPDFGDSIVFIISFFPLVLGIMLTGLGLFAARTDRLHATARRGTVIVHSGLVTAWLLAALYAYVRIRIDMAVPCAP